MICLYNLDSILYERLLQKKYKTCIAAYQLPRRLPQHLPPKTALRSEFCINQRSEIAQAQNIPWIKKTKKHWSILFVCVCVRACVCVLCLTHTACPCRPENHRGCFDSVSKEAVGRDDPDRLLPERVCANRPAAVHGKPAAEVREGAAVERHAELHREQPEHGAQHQRGLRAFQPHRRFKLDRVHQ